MIAIATQIPNLWLHSQLLNQILKLLSSSPNLAPINLLEFKLLQDYSLGLATNLYKTLVAYCNICNDVLICVMLINWGLNVAYAARRRGWPSLHPAPCKTIHPSGPSPRTLSELWSLPARVMADSFVEKAKQKPPLPLKSAQPSHNQLAWS